MISPIESKITDFFGNNIFYKISIMNDHKKIIFYFQNKQLFLNSSKEEKATFPSPITTFFFQFYIPDSHLTNSLLHIIYHRSLA